MTTFQAETKPGEFGQTVFSDGLVHETSLSARANLLRILHVRERCLKSSNMSGKPKINYVELARERGLGLGLDVTNYSPWKNKTSFQVRRCFTQDDIVVMREPGTVVHYSHDVLHRKDMIFNTNTQPGALSAAVKVGMAYG